MSKEIRRVAKGFVIPPHSCGGKEEEEGAVSKEIRRVAKGLQAFEIYSELFKSCCVCTLIKILTSIQIELFMTPDRHVRKNINM